MRQLLFVVFGICSVCSFAVIAADKSVPSESVPDTEYRIGPHDLLEIEVFRVPDLSRTARVDAGGEVSLPLVGSVKAAGLSSGQLEEMLASILQKNYLQNPHVSVFIKEYTSQRVTVEGAVNKPGIYALQGRTSLLQTIAMAQGLDDLADPGHIQLFRGDAEGGRKSLTFDVRAIRKGDVNDPLMSNDDVIVVHRSGGRSIVREIANTLRGFIGFGTVPY